MTDVFDTLEYENRQTRLVAVRNVQRIETPGLSVAEVEEKGEFTAPLWVARLLVEAGQAKWGEQGLTPEEWTQTHFKERFNPGGPPSALPGEFYARAYLSLDLAGKEASGDTSKQEALNRVRARYREIIESRVGKITRLASTETTPQSGVLQPEEETLHNELRSGIAAWRRDVRRLAGG